MSGYEAAGALFGILSVYLLARERVWGWPVGAVNVALFVVVFHDARLYADMGLQVFYFGLCLYGWYAWRDGGRARGPLLVACAPRRAWPVLAALGAVTSALLGFVLHRHTDAALPWVDAATTAFSLIAQWMQARKWIENWWVWIAVDVVYVGMYVSKALYLTAGLYLVFLGLAGVGLVEWSKSLRAARPAGSSSS